MGAATVAAAPLPSVASGATGAPGAELSRLDQDQPVFLIWFADLDQTDDDPYRKQPLTPPVITADDVAKIQGGVIEDRARAGS